MKIILFLFLLLIQSSFGCDVINLQDASRAAERTSFFETGGPGVRIAFGGMKNLNKIYGIGAVNNIVAEYQRRLCGQVDELAERGARLTVRKTDFKGFYITCSGNCDNIEDALRSVEPPRFPNTTTHSPQLQINTATGSSYREAYILARINGSYPEFRSVAGATPGVRLTDFINSEFTEAEGIARAGYDRDIARRGISFDDYLAQQVDLFRTGGSDAVNPQFRRLIQIVDHLEIPFENSNDIGQELPRILGNFSTPPVETPEGIPPYSMRHAQTGDDLFLAVFDSNNHLVRILGADARGLGVVNITSRYQELRRSLRPNGAIQFNSVDDIITASRSGITGADTLMDESMNRYREIVEHWLSAPSETGLTLEQRLGAAHEHFRAELPENGLMDMRAGSICGCQGQSAETVMNRISGLHGQLKDLERAGINGHFGVSCIGLEFFINRYGLRQAL